MTSLATIETSVQSRLPVLKSFSSSVKFLSALVMPSTHDVMVTDAELHPVLPFIFNRPPRAILYGSLERMVPDEKESNRNFAVLKQSCFFSCVVVSASPTAAAIKSMEKLIFSASGLLASKASLASHLLNFLFSAAPFHLMVKSMHGCANNSFC